MSKRDEPPRPATVSPEIWECTRKVFYCLVDSVIDGEAPVLVVTVKKAEKDILVRVRGIDVENVCTAEEVFKLLMNGAEKFGAPSLLGNVQWKDTSDVH